MRTVSFEWAVVGGSGPRVNAMMDVIEGLMRAWVRTSEPMKPVLPRRMSFMFVLAWCFICELECCFWGEEDEL